MGSTIGRAPHTGQISGADIPESVITTAHIGNASIQGEDLAANVYVDTTGNIATTGTLNAGTTTVDSFKQNSTKTLSGTYADHEVIIADSFQFSGDLIINDNLVLSKLSDDGNAISLTPDGSGDTTITGTGQLETSTIAQTPVTSVSGMTGELGTGVTMTSAVTGSPALNLNNATFPAGHVIQTTAPYVVTGATQVNNSTTLVSDLNYNDTGVYQDITKKFDASNSNIIMHWSYSGYVTGGSAGSHGMVVFHDSSNYYAMAEDVSRANNNSSANQPFTHCGSAIFTNIGVGTKRFYVSTMRRSTTAIGFRRNGVLNSDGPQEAHVSSWVWLQEVLK